MPVKKVLQRYVPEDIEPAIAVLPEAEDAERKTFGDTVFKHVGECMICGTPVYRWESGPQNDKAIGNSLVVYVASSHRTPPALCCQKDDPNAEHRNKTIVLNPTQKPPKIGDIWKPRA